MEARKEALFAGIEDLREKSAVFAARVAPLYVILNWSWSDVEGPPTAKEIETTLVRLLDMLSEAVERGDLDNKNEHHCSTGGLEVGYCGKGQFVMSFIEEEWVERSDWIFTEE